MSASPSRSAVTASAYPCRAACSRAVNPPLAFSCGRRNSANGSSFPSSASGTSPGQVELPRRLHRGLHLGRRRLGVAQGESLQHCLLPLLGGLGEFIIGRQIHRLRSGAWVRPALEESTDGIHAITRRGKDQRRLPPRLLPCVHRGPVVDQGGDRRNTPGIGGKVQRGRPACARRARRVGTHREEQFDDLRLPGGARDVKRCVVPDAGHGIHGGAALEQRFQEFRIASLGSPVQGRHAVPVRGVGVLALGEQGADRRKVTEAGSIGHGRRSRRRRDPDASDQQRRESGAEASRSSCQAHWFSPSPDDY